MSSAQSAVVEDRELNWLDDRQAGQAPALIGRSAAVGSADRDPDEGEPSIGPGAFPGIRRPFRSLLWLIQVVVGLVFLVGLLALLAAIPGLSLLTLGCLLDAEGRVARSGRIRDGFPLLAISSRTGMILLMVSIFLIPVQMLSVQAASQGIIINGTPLAPGGFLAATRILQTLLFMHLLLAIANGGAFWNFFRPIRNCRRLLASIRRRRYLPAVDYWADRLLKLFKPVEHVMLAVKGAVGAFIWLLVPTALIALSHVPRENPVPAGLGSFLGGLILIPVAAWLPLLQAHQAATGRFMAIFEVRTVRRLISRVPVRWAVATILLYALALPLYFTKIRLPAEDAMWLVTPLFVLLTYPTRILMGWVYGAGMQSQEEAWFAIRWATRLFMIPVLGFYGLILFVTPFISEAGRAAMFENHAFLLPVPVGRLFGG
jgi:hypothetical protein